MQSLSYFHIPIQEKSLTIVLASVDVVNQDMMYEKICQDVKKTVGHVVCADSDSKVKSPAGFQIHEFQLIDDAQIRENTILQFCEVCSNAASHDQVVVIYGKEIHTPFPLLAARMLEADFMNGYGTIVRRVSENMNDYIRECSKIVLKTNSENMEKAKDIQNFMEAHKLVNSLFEMVLALNQYEHMKHKISETFLECNLSFIQAPPGLEQWDCFLGCKSDLQSLRQCWHCDQWICKKCSYWCTLCPKENQYLVCSVCNSLQTLVKKKGNKWACHNHR